ncbi:hypothetical protein G432_07790 [Sphingomonas sp. MM-1]|uniref:hypothetical protein n=1 Tax=Sphingomonas sp. MM-1 TaxID=745310 RepID=UPI0002C11FF1|nr:hypothetical protein [Sphingomonas sp. MM-1]AGH49283.1 hypothetical protein G432_07790 [Sphingomonas sp. MM-1]
MTFWEWIAVNKEQLGILITGAGVPLLLWQVTQSGRQERRRLRRRHAAARSTLPLTLSAICAYAGRAGAELRPMFYFYRGRGPHLEFTPPVASDQIIAAIERMIEAASKEEIAHRLADIASRMQVLSARMNGLVVSPSVFRSLVGELILDAAEIDALASSLFAFARRHTEKAPPPLTKSDIRNALHRIGCDEERDSEIYTALGETPQWQALPPWWRRLGNRFHKPILAEY